VDEGVLIIPETKGVSQYAAGKWLSYTTEKITQL